MRTKGIYLLLILALALTACGNKVVEDPIALLDQEKNQVTFPQEKPTLFFFITTYT